MKIKTYNHNGTLLGTFAGTKDGLKEAFGDCVEYVSETHNTATIKHGDRVVEVVTLESIS